MTIIQYHDFMTSMEATKKHCEFLSGETKYLLKRSDKAVKQSQEILSSLA